MITVPFVTPRRFGIRYLGAGLWHASHQGIVYDAGSDIWITERMAFERVQQEVGAIRGATA